MKIKCEKHGLTKAFAVKIKNGVMEICKTPDGTETLVCIKCVAYSMVPIGPLCPTHHEPLKEGYCTECDKTYDLCTSSFVKFAKKCRCVKLKDHDDKHMSAYLYKWTDEDAKRFDIKYKCTGCFKRGDYNG